MKKRLYIICLNKESFYVKIWIDSCDMFKVVRHWIWKSLSQLWKFGMSWKRVRHINYIDRNIQVLNIFIVCLKNALWPVTSKNRFKIQLFIVVYIIITSRTRKIISGHLNIDLFATVFSNNRENTIRVTWWCP